jgi:hypothetical protein
MKRHLLAFFAFAGLAAPSQAQEGEALVTASDPQSIVSVLAEIGFAPELTKDGIGDPMIVARESSGFLTVIFFGCDEATNDNCASIRMQVGLDRAEPWNAEEAIRLSQQLPFIGVRLDDEGDPFVHWDVYLGEGMARGVFMENARRFVASAAEAASIVFADELVGQMK